MFTEVLAAKIEAIVFAGGDAVPMDRIAQVLDIDMAKVLECTEFLKEKYNKTNSGISFLVLDNQLQMTINPAFAAEVRATLELKRNTPLSQAAMEVLAVVAYNQPITKAFVEQVRGVDCSGVIGSLVDKGLIEERGRLELPGRPLLYGTTDTFLRCFNISSINELPDASLSINMENMENLEDIDPDQISF